MDCQWVYLPIYLGEQFYIWKIKDIRSVQSVILYLYLQHRNISLSISKTVYNKEKVEKPTTQKRYFKNFFY